MRQIMIMAVIVVSMAVAAARMVDHAGRNGALPAAVAVMAPQEQHHGFVVIPPDVRGHFVVDARVDGRRIMRFMVDTGATAVALTARDAAALGIHPGARDFNVQVNTANGSTRAAQTQLGMIEVADINVRNVTALVSVDDALGENLLGLSFLKRLKHVDLSDGQMVLEQ
jgi:aspartyl protease family protein